MRLALLIERDANFYLTYQSEDFPWGFLETLSRVPEEILQWPKFCVQSVVQTWSCAPFVLFCQEKTSMMKSENQLKILSCGKTNISFKHDKI